MSRYLDFFDLAYYINLDSRLDRRKSFEEQASVMGINAIRFPAITPKAEDYSPPSSVVGSFCRSLYRFRVGCTLSHIACVRLAKEAGAENVLVFEDDCVFVPNAKEKLTGYVEQIREMEWDIFYLGGNPNAKFDHVSGSIYTIKRGGLYSCHAYAVNSRFYDTFLQFDERSAIDITLLHAEYAVRLLGRECLAEQTDGWSDLCGEMRKFETRMWCNQWDKMIKGE